MAGRLVLVVGPSGAGKDTLIRAAKSALEGDGRFSFMRRVVTRTADAALEDHESVSEEAFAATQAAGGFALSWRAHGLAYGVPCRLADEIDAGRIVVVNGSRAVVEAARRKFAGTAVILVEATAAIRAQRLTGRGRETIAQIAARLAREADAPSPEAIRVDNSAGIAEGVERFIAALRDLAAR